MTTTETASCCKKTLNEHNDLGDSPIVAFSRELLDVLIHRGSFVIDSLDSAADSFSLICGIFK